MILVNPLSLLSSIGNTPLNIYFNLKRKKITNFFCVYLPKFYIINKILIQVKLSDSARTKVFVKCNQYTVATNAANILLKLCYGDHLIGTLVTTAQQQSSSNHLCGL